MNLFEWLPKMEPEDMVALLLVCLAAVLLLNGIQDHVEAIITTILGFYFGHKITTTTQNNMKKDQQEPQ